MDYRPLEGFVLAITPFNFTAIAGNLPSAPALLGNVVVWKPSPTQQLAAHHTMRLFEAAGLPPGVINMVTGDGAAVSEAARAAPGAGRHPLHRLDRRPSSTCGARSANGIGSYATYPRLVGETGGKDFVVAHPSADPAALVTGLVRGAFEYQGQKCSAASRAYVPRSLWDGGRARRTRGGDRVAELRRRDRLRQLRRRGDRPPRVRPAQPACSTACTPTPSATVLAGGKADDTVGLLRPADRASRSTDPTHEMFRDEYFGPILAVHVYDDADWAATLTQLESVGAVRADRRGVRPRPGGRRSRRQRTLRFAAGNFYVNDKPTGAVVGQQPFGGARASGTNDKAGSIWNLLRWVSPRAIKETFVAADRPPLPAHGLTCRTVARDHGRATWTGTGSPSANRRPTPARRPARRGPAGRRRARAASRTPSSSPSTGRAAGAGRSGCAAPRPRCPR